MATNYQRGRALEYRAQAALIADGYYAQRSPGSKGIADILAVKKGQTLFVQCKRGTGQMLSAADWNELVATAARHGGLPIYAEATPGGQLWWWLLTGPRQPRQRANLPREQWWPDYADRPGGAP